MAIERLSFNSDGEYSAIELAIHLARYSTAQSLCRGQRVLDVACGEGYGSYAMASLWGATSVTGVDISEEAINTARNVFAHPNVKFISAPAENIDRLLEPNSFDLVISLETIEHVNDPDQFLSAIKHVLKPEGVAVISCPNDHWYYGPGESQNPFHLRTYYFDEFKELAEKHLGEATCYFFGRPLDGFGNFLHDDSRTISDKGMTGELKSVKPLRVNLISTDQNVSTENCSYFIGVWGDLPVEKEELVNCALYPISMDKFSVTLEDLNASLTSRLKHLGKVEERNAALEAALSGSESRVSELEKWAAELQTALSGSESRVSELEKWAVELQSDLLEVNKEAEVRQQTIGELQLEIQEKRAALENLREKIENAENVIKTMQASKFWKLRNQLVKLKNILPVNKKDL